jgi:hypothetical protein
VVIIERFIKLKTLKSYNKMVNEDISYIARREVGWGSGIRKDLSTGVNRHEIQILEDNSLIDVFRSDVDQCKPKIESEARKYVERMKKNNPDKSYEMKVAFNETFHRREPRFKG